MNRYFWVFDFQFWIILTLYRVLSLKCSIIYLYFLTPLLIRLGGHARNVYFKLIWPSGPSKWGSSFCSEIETWLCEVCYRVAAGSFLWRQHIVWLLNAFCHMPLVTLKDTQVMECSQFFSFLFSPLLPSSRIYLWLMVDHSKLLDRTFHLG